MEILIRRNKKRAGINPALFPNLFGLITDPNDAHSPVCSNPASDVPDLSQN